MLHARRVHTITDRFSMANTYLINEERMVVVDPGTELNVRQLQSYLQHFLHRPLQQIDLIVLTHLHPDHTSGVEMLRSICDAPVAASAVARNLIMQQRGELHSSSIAHLAEHILTGPLQHVDLFPPVYERQYKLVDIWLEDVEGLPGHPEWRVISSPGHTPDSLCLYNPFSQELLCGDTVITIQGGAPLLRGSANRRQLHETLRVLRSLQVHYLYPGHGRPILALHPLTNIDVEW
ncbi:MBL fold metallo-hydrolase [Dictyobacter aurantiacus]|nr:MBL fold metallo-hydrolase [Dictyobacter aurantiacus]